MSSSEMNYEPEGPMSFNLIAPAGHRYFVPSKFKLTIAAHYVKTMIPELTSSLILAIQGRTGSGKTFQTLESCSQLGINVLVVSGYELASKYEGGPARIMRQYYEFALGYVNDLRRPTVLMIDDFDTSIVSVRSSQGNGYSVNSQLLTDFFMNLPRIVPTDKRPVPVIVTGNNFNDLYEPLVRYGRFTFFDWDEPSPNDKLAIVTKILENTVSGQNNRAFEKILTAFPDQPIAYFSELRNACIEAYIVHQLETSPSIPIHTLVEQIRSHPPAYSAEQIIGMGRKLLTNRPKSFLTNRRP